MEQPRSSRWIVLCLCAPALLALGAARAEARIQGTTTVTVTIRDSGIEVAPMYIPSGAVVFKIANKGTVARDFKVGGKQTAKIPAGSSTVLNINVSTEHNYPYYSAAAGRATLNGILVVIPATVCEAPETTSVTVKIGDGPVSLSKAKVHCGTVKFTVKNVGTEPHAFTVYDTGSSSPAPGGTGPRLRPGKTGTMTVKFVQDGRAFYFCREPQHSSFGERGFLVVV
jgi:uncharacterized cupredoxin-like copper-binding protein